MSLHMPPLLVFLPHGAWQAFWNWRITALVLAYVGNVPQGIDVHMLRCVPGKGQVRGKCMPVFTLGQLLAGQTFKLRD